MIQRVEDKPADPVAPPEAAGGGSPTVWGLTARELHDAFWASRGVQVVRRGTAQRLQRAAELYLLLEPDQLVVFNVAELSDRLNWHNALVTRLRLIDRADGTYRERVVLDGAGFVRRIERCYRPRERGTSRVVLCTSRRVATIWSVAATRREGWDRVRRSVPWIRVDHGKCPGVIGTLGDPALHRDILDAIVERWPTPAQAIDGIEEVESGVWQLSGESTAAATVRIGPLWLGRGRAGQDRPCLVGPRWLPDHDDDAGAGDAGAAPRRAQLRPIAQVELADVARPAPEHRPALTYALVKRAMDITLSAAALVVAAPLLPLIAIMILLEDGRPVFFGHIRQGRGGRPFACWKFRTMHHHAQQIAWQLEAYNQADGPQVFIRDDPRVTRVGRYLRKSHLDEFPQFFNVLVGQMSLVGPRPSPDDENQFCPAWRDLRLSVRPGITGLWQLQRTREPGEDFQEWIRYDIEYVENASLWLDLKIMVRTAWMMARGRPERASE